MDKLTNFWNTVLTQREWSWAVLGIVYLLLFLVIRSFFLHQLIKNAKGLNSKWYREIKKVYAKKCAAGWVFFLISLLMMIYFWQKGNFQQVTIYEVGMLILVTALLSILSTVIAFGVSVIQVLKLLENNQMTL